MNKMVNPDYTAKVSRTAERRGCNDLQSRRGHGHTETETLSGTAERRGCIGLQGRRRQGHTELSGEKRRGITLAVSSTGT